MTISTSTDVWRMTAVELAAAIRARRLSCREVVEAHLRRIDAVNPAINAVTVVLAEEALDAAKAADRLVVAGAGDLPPLLGVPFTVKANIDVAGTPTTQGLKMFADAYPAADAPSVERLRLAGAIPLGRTNMASMAVRWHCVSELWGATINPWDRARTPGASSGGEAAALATGMTPLGVGNDGLGSMRWPAQCCGITALKPTLGRVPTASSIEPDSPIGAQLMIVEGPMARTVGDLAVALEVMTGPSWRDPWSVPAPLLGPRPPGPTRVAVVTDPAGGGTDPLVKAGVGNAARALEEAGYLVEEIEPPSIVEAAEAGLGMLNTPEFRARLPLLALLPAETAQFLTDFYQAAGDPDPVATIQHFAARQSILRAWSRFQETYPLIVAPISTAIAFGAGADLQVGQVRRSIHDMRMAIAVNALGLPAVALPVGVGDGLPQSVQVIGPRYREDLCIQAASVLEDRLGVITPIDPR